MKGEVALRRHEIIMFYKSTRNSALAVDSATAISQGISADGGLFVPSEIPSITMDEIRKLSTMRYADRAAYIFAKYLTDFTEAEIHHCTDSAYNTKAFETDAIAEISHLFDGTYMLELWHGPTCAFKDMALQVLPYFLTTAAKKKALNKKIVILVATSGDTGKAALDGFKDVPGTEILVFYPEEGVSPMQKRQMRTQEGGNVGVCAIKGNFDDCQNGVKAIFTDPQVKQQLDQAGLMFSSANSINWGRLLPQIVYYISAYATLAADGEINFGDLINVVVPTGNFGNILACWYAGQMGLPVGKLICASNSNNVLTDFLATGTYDRNRPFHTTMSPSMDILVSSNLERLLFALSGQDDKLVADYMQQLNKHGSYTVSDEIKAKLKSDFYGGFCSEEETSKVIAEVWKKYNYLIDPHTAVAYDVMEKYRQETGDTNKTVFVSTASPFKFCDSVLHSLGVAEVQDGIDALDQLSQTTNRPAPVPLASLRNKAVRFTESVDKEKMEDVVLEMLK